MCQKNQRQQSFAGPCCRNCFCFVEICRKTKIATYGNKLLATGSYMIYVFCTEKMLYFVFIYITLPAVFFILNSRIKTATCNTPSQ